jgi:hypothetical protein
LADAAYRQQLWDGGAAAVAGSDDPMIQFVRRWDYDARAARDRYTVQVAAPVAHARERLAQARFRAFGLDLYPDTTFSPRLSYGRIEGWNEGAAAVPAFTRIGDLYAHAGASSHILAPSWAGARAQVDRRTLLNMSVSTDTLGGSSGSAVLDRDGQVVGVVFDGNTHALGGQFYYDAALNRSIAVSSQAIGAALRYVYGMSDLLAELQN